jgi:hypothetical protein
VLKFGDLKHDLSDGLMALHVNNLSIELHDSSMKYPDKLMASGVLKIGDFVEHFEAPLSYWDREKYLSQWREGLLRVAS